MAGDRKKFGVAMSHAQRFSEQGNWTEAFRAYRFALAEFPKDQVAIVGFGKAAYSTGQVELAQKAFQQALKLDPSNWQVLSYMGEIQEQLGQLEVAAETYLRIGNIFAAQDNLEAAIDSWLRATQLVPNHVDAHHKLAQALVQQDQPRQAARQLLTLAAVYQKRNNHELAVEQVQAAQDLIGDDPGITAALEALDQGRPIEPEKITDAFPEEEEADEADHLLELTEFADTYPTDEFFDEEDPFAVVEAEPTETAKGGLIETAQQDALAELANVIFDDEASSEPYTGTIPRDELNMLIVQAIDLQSRENIANAVENYRQVVRAGVGSSALYFNLGLLNKQLGQFDEAAKMLRAAAQADKYNLPAHIALGETYYAVNDLESAIRYFIEAIKLADLETVDEYRASGLIEYYESLADQYIAEGDGNKITRFITAVENFFAKPDWQKKTHLARQRMNSVAENGNVMSLAEFLESPETEIVITALAVTGEYLRRNFLMTASEECLRAIQKAPTHLTLHIRLGDILLRQDLTDVAITKYLSVARVYQIRNQPDRAIEIYQKILRLAPMDVTVRSKLIDLYISNQKVEQALEQYLTLANSYYQLAQVDRALEKYNEALRLTADVENADTWKADILNNMGDIYNQRFDWARAAASYEELRKVKPGDERTMRQLVDLYFKQRKTDKAVSVLDGLMEIYQQQNQPAKSLQLLKELAINNPDNMPLRQRLALAYSQNNMKKKAIAEYDALGEMQMERGMWDDAAETIQAILTLGPEDAEGYRLLLSKIHGGGI